MGRERREEGEEREVRSREEVKEGTHLSEAPTNITNFNFLGIS